MAAHSGKDLRAVAVVLAGGVGARIGFNLPKQLIKIAGKSVVEHTIEALNDSADIDEIIVMMTPGFLDPILAIRSGGKYPKFTHVFEGGGDRNQTTQLAIDALGDAEVKVLFHDAVRPFVDNRIIHDCVVALDAHSAVDTAIRSADTIIEVSDDGFLVDVPPRSKLRRGQTPQGFRLSAIRAAYEKARLDPNFTATDDCTVVLRYTPDVRIAVVAGSDENMKVTEPIDIAMADKLFQLRSSTARELAESARTEGLAGKTLVVFGGGYGIGAEVCSVAKDFGANVFSFSRSETKTHVQNREEVRAALKQAADATGQIDYVVNSTGLLAISLLEEASDDIVYETIDVNLVGCILIAQESLPYLRQTSGQLLNFTSSSYTRGRGGYSLYSATKAAIVNFTQALADEWIPDAVRVNVVNPDRTRTPLRTKAFGNEPADTLLSARAVALAAIDTLISGATGHVIDVRRDGSPVDSLATEEFGD
ncbi:MAG TPA: bifunctional cytidylyltransferase/SDR family oxidoreductase [Galbitalea sp.]|nr:bifunctional cytidylyltransferase/SDR family oxidoreductase [Galbitalea sp.]